MIDAQKMARAAQRQAEEVEKAEKAENSANSGENSADEGPDAQIIVMRGPNGEMLTEPDAPDARAKARKGAQERRAVFEHRLTGAKARAGKLPRLLTAQLAAGSTNLMLAKILQEELQPATAKEAADIAKITHAIWQQASGQSAGNLNLTPVERETRMNEIDNLSKELARRAQEATDSLGGAPAEGEEVAEPESNIDGPISTPDVASPSTGVPTSVDDGEWEHESTTG